MKERKILNTRKVKTMYYTKEEIKEIAAKIKAADNWMDVADEVEAICDAAGMLDELKEADDRTFESVIFKAADTFGVELI